MVSTMSPGRALVIKTVDRYGIYLADLDPTHGREMAKTRPVVVVSQNAMNRNLDTIVVCPLTTQLHPRWRSRIQCQCVRRNAEIAVDQIRAISRGRLVKRLDRLDPSLETRLRALIVEMYGQP
jgi:mRNA interferase MazF